MGATPDAERPPYRWAFLAGGLVFFLYAITLAPTTAFWDTSEYIATAHIMGIPHPPGNPTFVVLARAWEILLTPLGLSAAVSINLLSAFMSAAAHGLWFLVVHHILRRFTEDKTFPLVGASVAVLVSATAFTVWNQSNVNEKVYTVTLFTIALLTWLAFHWRENLGKGKDDNLLVLMVFILAFSVGNHLMAFLVAPAMVLFVLWLHPRTLMNWKLYLAAGVATFAGLSIHLFLPIRSGLFPVINEAAPICESVSSAVISIVTYGQGGCENLSDALARKQYVKPPLQPRLAALHMQYANYLQYFDWQWARVMGGINTVFAPLRIPFTFLFTALGIYGAVEHFKKDRVTAWYILTLFATLSVALVYYLNFKYGYSLASPLNDREIHEVRERDYFFIVSFSIWGLWAGIGIAALWRRLAQGSLRSYKRAAPVLGLSLLPLVLNWGWASRAKDYAARDFAYNMLMSVEPYAILFTNGDNDTFPLWYLQEVEGIRRDVTVIVNSYLNTAWYVKQLRNLTTPCPEGVDASADYSRSICQRPYDASNTPAMYTHDAGIAEALGKIPILMGHPVTPPARPILDLDDRTIEQLQRTYPPMDQTRSYRIGDIVATLQAGQVGPVLYPWHQFALIIIDQSLGDRPVYFASSGSAGRELGLTPYLIREGLAYKVHNGDPWEFLPGGVVELPPSEYLSVLGLLLNAPRTNRLVWEVYIHRSGLPDEWSHWPDRSTIGIPNYYAWTYYALFQAATLAGDEEEGARNRDRGDALGILGQN